MSRFNGPEEFAEYVDHVLRAVGDDIGVEANNVSDYGCIFGAGNINPENTRDRFMIVLVTREHATALRKWVDELHTAAAKAAVSAHGAKSIIKPITKEWPS